MTNNYFFKAVSKIIFLDKKIWEKWELGKKGGGGGKDGGEAQGSTNVVAVGEP